MKKTIFLKINCTMYNLFCIEQCQKLRKNEKFGDRGNRFVHFFFLGAKELFGCALQFQMLALLNIL